MSFCPSNVHGNAGPCLPLAIAPNKYIFLLLVNILLLIIGMFMENSLQHHYHDPLLAPIAASYGVNLTHFGCIVCNLAIGMVTPPLGSVSSPATIWPRPSWEISRALIPHSGRLHDRPGLGDLCPDTFPWDW